MQRSDIELATLPGAAARERIEKKRQHREQNPGILIQLQRFVIVVTGAIVTLLMATQVTTRYVFGFSIYGIEEAMSFVAIWMYFLGSAHGSWDRGHISADLVDVIFPVGRTQQAFRVLARVLTVIISSWMTVWAVQYFLNSFNRNLISLEVGIPLTWVHSAIPVGLALMTFYFFVELIEEWQIFRDMK